MSRPQPRPPGSFSPLPGTSSSSIANNAPQPPPISSSRPPPPRRIDSSDSEDLRAESGLPPPINISKTRQQQSASPIITPIHTQFTTSQSNASSPSLHHNNFSRPARGPPPGASSPLMRNHTRKHSANPGLFEPTLPSTSTSNLSQIGMSQGNMASGSTATLSASQIAAQAAVMSHQNSQQQLLQQHSRQRSQTVPNPGDSIDGPRRGSGNGRGPVSPPLLSLTEASAPRDTAFGHSSQDKLVPGNVHSSAATAAANVVFPRSGHNSPSQQSSSLAHQMPPPPLPLPIPEKQSKSEKARAKLFSRPSKISTKMESKEKPLPSPGKIGSALSVLQRSNFSTTSLAEPGGSSIYNHSNSSAATIRPNETPTEERGKDKEKRHHFLSRQKNKLKDEFHLPLSSAASNSLPTDPHAPNSLYSFNIPASPGPTSSSFAKAKKDKKLAERSESRLGYFDEAGTGGAGDWSGPGSFPSLSQQTSMYDPIDPGKLGLHNHMTLDDAWPYLKAKLLVIFEGEDLRLPVEDFNRVVQMHIQYCIARRSPNSMVEDLRDLLAMGFGSLDRTLRKTPEDRFMPTLVELWLFTFTSILPYMQAVFLPLDLEVSGSGTIMTPEQARDFFGGVVAIPSSSDGPARVAPAATAFDVRRLVLTAYRDFVIIPRYDTLKTIFSRLSLEFLPSSFASMALSSPRPDSHLSTSPPEQFPPMVRPGTAMSLDPSNASYNSTSTTLLDGSGGGSIGGRSRAISNVSFGSHASDGVAGSTRPFTPSSAQVLGSVREQNVEDSKQVTDMVGRMLQCMSVLSSLGGAMGDDENNWKMVELCKMLKLNWLGRGRTGGNRMGIVGGRVRREGTREELRVA